MIRLFIMVSAALLAAAPAVGDEYTIGGVTVARPWARATPTGAQVAGAFMEIKTGPGATDRLVGAGSDIAARVEVHTHLNENGVMKMRRVDGIALLPGGSVVLKPGGYHLMLFDLKQPLRQGERFKLMLQFEKAGEIVVEATVAPIGAPGPLSH